MVVREKFPQKNRGSQISPTSQKREIRQARLPTPARSPSLRGRRGASGREGKANGGQGIWSRCAACNGVIFQRELQSNFWVCPKCDFHYRLSASKWITFLTDKGSFEEFDSKLFSQDPLAFVANKSYQESLCRARERTGLIEAVLTGEAFLERRKVILVVMDFEFIGGSMASVVGEKISRAAERATLKKTPLITVSSSGGARMQEGMLSLMQMAKTSAAIGHLHRARIPFISILTHPTTGGVAASFATLADVIIAEPKALIGFAGPRVIEDTIRQKLPKGFQRSEFMLEHGMVDMLVHRKNLKSTLSKLLGFFSTRKSRD